MTTRDDASAVDNRSYCDLQAINELSGHRDWVTSLSILPNQASTTLISASRDKTLMLWHVVNESEEVPEAGASNSEFRALKSLTGHSGAVSDVAVSSDGKFALSGSWDKTMRLWDLEMGAKVRSFTGHTKDVFSVALSADNRQIVSGSRDMSIKLWNTLATCKYTLDDQKHTGWVSCVRFSPGGDKSLVSSGWDGMVKLWDLAKCKLNDSFYGHTESVYTVAISPDGSLCASAGKDGSVMLWDVAKRAHLHTLMAGASVNSLCFSPCHYWLCAATDKSVKIWDLDSKHVLSEVTHASESFSKQSSHGFKSLTWSANGEVLYSGCTDGNIYVYRVNPAEL